MSKAGTDERLERLTALLSEPGHADHPLAAALAEAIALCKEQQSRIQRMVRIADGFQSAALGQTASALRRQRSRLDKVARIADRYQELMHAQNLSLSEAASVDALTGLANRRLIDATLEEMVARTHRRGQALTLVMVDVDHFKRINDRFGHDVGDAALTSLAQVFKTTLRDQDFCGRWGGEEFIILLPGTPLTGARAILERVQLAIHQLGLEVAGEALHLTASFGAAQRLPGELSAELVRRADGALRSAKQLGRDRIELAGELQG